jgi:hypothetical protein
LSRFYLAELEEKMRHSLIVPLIVGAILTGLSSAMAADYTPPAASSELLEDIDFAAATPVDEDYRAEFKRCDDHNEFRNQTLTGFRRCTTPDGDDKNNVRALLKLADGSIYYESKMSLDLDGSWKTWHDPAVADQRTTSFQWRPKTCTAAERDAEGECAREQVDAEHVPFIVIPNRGPTTALGREFRDQTGVALGDFGVIIYRDRWVPGFVADGGPYNKLGEGSAAAFEALGEDRCREHNADGFCTRYRDASIEKDVVTIIFPGSRRDDLTAANVMEVMCEEAKERLGFTGSPLCE